MKNMEDIVLVQHHVLHFFAYKILCNNAALELVSDLKPLLNNGIPHFTRIFLN